ncbi:MAG: BT_3987 domain-containing protein [Bacteroidales bacterium]
MKKIKKQARLFLVLAILSGFALASCKEEVADQGIYMYSAQVVSEEIFTVSTTTDAHKDIIAASSSLVASDITVDFATDQAAIADYNKLSGTAYKPLPDNYYSLTSTSSVIKNGTNTSAPIQLVIKPMPEDADGIEKGVEYAVAISIVRASGDIPVLDASKTLIVAVQSPSYTNLDDTNVKADGALVNGPTGGWGITTNTESKSSYPTGALIDGKDGTPRFPIKEDLGFPQILTLDKQAVKTVNGFMFTPVYDYGADNHNVYTMEVHSSNDGNSWKLQGTWNNEPKKIDPESSEANPDYRYLKFLVPVKARFFKFTITSGGGIEASFAEIYSIE